MLTFKQGLLTSMCGIYAIVNAERVANKSTEYESQTIFNNIIGYLSKKRKLKSSIIDGIIHKTMLSIINDVVSNRFSVIETNKRSFYNLSEWWQYTKTFLDEADNRSVILSLDGIHEHLTVIQSMSDKVMYLSDSDGIKTIRKSSCKLPPYKKEDKHVIFYSQCFYLQGLDR